MLLTLSAFESVLRARKIAALSTSYILGAGGRNPSADTPFTVKKGKLGSDCIGFVLWCLGLDRYQPVDKQDLEFPFYGGWINTDSMLMDVKAKALYFEESFRPEIGQCVVYPSIWKDGKMIRMGHVGLVVKVPEEWPCDWQTMPAKEKTFWLKQVKVIDCAGAKWRKLIGKAVSERDATLWNKPDAKFVKYKWQGRYISETYIDSTREPVMAVPKLGDRLLMLQRPIMLRGQDVKDLQKKLGIKADGIFGSTTESAVKAFQRKHGLFEDGIVGTETLSKL